MFERFTDRARKVIVLAQDEARRLNLDYIGPELLLLGLSREGQGVGAIVLQSLEITPEAIAAIVERDATPARSPVGGHIPFTSGAKKVLEMSLREALQLGHPYIGTEHILLGLIRQEGRARAILEELEYDMPQVKRAVMTTLGGLQVPTASSDATPFSEVSYDELLMKLVQQLQQEVSAEPAEVLSIAQAVAKTLTSEGWIVCRERP